MDMLIHSKRLGLEIEEINIDTIYYDNNVGTHFRPLKDGM